jgi:archaellum component FlaG (FlaF/FlaG flagellin family)
MSLEDYIGLFAVRSVFLNEEDADQKINAQAGYWYGVLNQIGNGLKSQGEDEAALLLEAVAEIIKQPGTFARKHVRDENGFRVTGRVPLITTNPFEVDSYIIQNPQKCLAVLLIESDGFVEAAQAAAVARDVSLQVLLSPLTQLEMVKYAHRKATLGVENALEGSLSSHLSEARSSLETTAKRAEEATAEIEVMRHDFEQWLTQNEAKFGAERRTRESESKKLTDSLSTDWYKFIKEARADVDAAVAQARETKALKGARQVWTDQHQKHRNVLFAGLVVLTLVVGLGIWAMIHWWSDLYDAIPKRGDEIITSALVLFVVPLVAVAWVMRIVVRMVHNAMTLSEDSEHRKAMLETYFQLVGDKEAGMEASDRILILNAIFRPLPGHQPNEVNPPTVLELAKEALSSNKS